MEHRRRTLDAGVKAASVVERNKHEAMNWCPLLAVLPPALSLVVLENSHTG
jgi:hypothetical protein